MFSALVKWVNGRVQITNALAYVPPGVIPILRPSMKNCLISKEHVTTFWLKGLLARRTVSQFQLRYIRKKVIYKIGKFVNVLSLTASYLFQ